MGSLGGAACRLIWHLAAQALAACGPASPCAYGCWLPTWLPGISLASLTSEQSNAAPNRDRSHGTGGQ